MIVTERYWRRGYARRVRAAALIGLGAAALSGSVMVAGPAPQRATAAAGETVAPVSPAKLATLREPVRVSRARTRMSLVHRVTARPVRPQVRPPVRFAPGVTGSIPAVWARVAACESGGDWHINTGNGYYGGVQEDLTFWSDYGGLRFAVRPDLASPLQQITVARRGLAAQGPSAWPVCGPRAGLQRGD